MNVRHPVEAIREDLRHEQRWPALEGLRGFAILGVVGYHVVRTWVGGGSWNAGSGSDRVPEPLWWLATGRLGVDVLFVLSGFLVYRSWESIRRRAGSLAAALKTYALRRGQRIMPAYWLSLAVFIPWFAPELLHPDHWRQLLLFLTAQAYWVRGLPDVVNTVYWTLTTEILFYVLLPLLAVGLRRRPLVVWGVCAALSVLWIHGELADVRGDLSAGFIGGRLDQFVFGCAISVVLARAERGQPVRMVRWASHPAAAWLALAAVLWLGQLQGSMLATDRHDWMAAALHPALAVCFGVMILSLIGRPGAPGWARWTWLRYLALISYSIYLWHFPILVEGIAAAGQARSGLGLTLPKLAVVGGLLMLIAAVSTASYLLAERPSIRARAARPAPVARGTASTPEAAEPPPP